MKKIYFIFFLTIPCLLLTQCQKKGKNLGTYSFSEQDKLIIPYSGNDTLTIIDSTGNSQVYYLNNRVDDYKPAYNPDDYINQFDIEKNDYYMMEYIDVYALGGHIGLRFTTPFSSPIHKYLDIYDLDISNLSEISGKFSGQWGFDNNQLYKIESDYNSDLTYYDSLTIFDNKYYSIYDLAVSSTPPPDSIETYRDIYYSISQGIIGFKTSKCRRFIIN